MRFGKNSGKPEMVAGDSTAVAKTRKGFSMPNISFSLSDLTIWEWIGFPFLIASLVLGIAGMMKVIPNNLILPMMVGTLGIGAFFSSFAYFDPLANSGAVREKVEKPKKQKKVKKNKGSEGQVGN